MKSIAVVCEARADFETATQLADRVFSECSQLKDCELSSIRQYVGEFDSDSFLAWKNAKKFADRQNIRIQGRFSSNEKNPPDYLTARRTLLAFQKCGRQIQAVMLVRDADKQPERKKGLDSARKHIPLPVVIGPAIPKRVPVVIGLAIPKREAWILAGFIPDANETGVVEQARREVGRNPTTNAEELTASTPGSKHDIKRVLQMLTKGDLRREERCIDEPSLEILRENGKNTGLAEYLDEVKERLVPLLANSQ